jgi:hypothetical protein
VAGRNPALVKVEIERGLPYEKSPTIPVSNNGPSLDEIADVLFAAAQFLRALLDRKKGGH